MEYPQNLYLLIANPVGQDIGCVINHQFAGAGYTTGPTQRWLFSQQGKLILDPRHQLPGGPRVVAGDVFPG